MITQYERIQFLIGGTSPSTPALSKFVLSELQFIPISRHCSIQEITFHA